jgi:hypothetical protein
MLSLCDLHIRHASMLKITSHCGNQFIHDLLADKKCPHSCWRAVVYECSMSQ